MAPGEPTNGEVADALEELGDLYELDGANVHRVLAYRNGARAVRGASVPVATLAREGRATELPGIGATLQEKIVALADTGSIPAAVKLKAKFPPGLVAITRLPGVGPKRTRLLHSELGIDSPQKLRDAALAQRVRKVRGLGAKFEQSVLAALDAGAGERPAARMLLAPATELGEALAAGLAERAERPDVVVQLAGSARRMTDSVKDIDLVAVTGAPVTLAKALAGLPQMERVTSAGRAGARGRTHAGVGVDLRIAKPAQHGNLLQHFTGSGAHNAAMREEAVRRGLHVSEYGVLDDASATTRRCATEEEVYAMVGLAYIEPELRENRGELEAARLDGGSGLPRLIELGDMRGDLHSHTLASDGHNTIEEMAQAARARGYEYLAITDHSASHGFGNEVSPDQLLAELDWVIASVHTAFRMSEQATTERMITAVEHPLVRAIGHPTGRLIERRAPYDVDLDAVFAAAARSRTLLEINANPDRRDLSDVHARAARAAGVTLVIDSDAHRTSTLANMRWGIATARRAWLAKDDVANTRPWRELRRLPEQ